MSKQAVIFDMDGVITDSEPLYGEAVNVVLADQGLFLTDEDHRQIMGSSIDYTWKWVMERFGLDGGIEQWKAPYDLAVADLLGTKSTPVPGLYGLLDGLESRGVKLGLATSSLTHWAEVVLAKLGVAERFPVIAACDMVAEAKPAPDLYLLAAQKLGAEPHRCLAIEDTPRGISSAKSAGLSVVGVRTESTAHMDISEADFIIQSLEEFDFSWLG
jgi:HAD superfamily hydrolase (TIGR01509 family)